MQEAVSKTSLTEKFPEKKKLPTNQPTRFLEAKMTGTKHFCPFHFSKI